MLCLYHVPISNLHNNDLKTKTFVSVIIVCLFFTKKKLSCHVHTVRVAIHTCSFNNNQVL